MTRHTDLQAILAAAMALHQGGQIEVADAHRGHRHGPAEVIDLTHRDVRTRHGRRLVKQIVDFVYVEVQPAKDSFRVVASVTSGVGDRVHRRGCDRVRGGFRARSIAHRHKHWIAHCVIQVTTPRAGINSSVR